MPIYKIVLFARDEWRKYWRNLRDSYVRKRRETRERPSGAAADRAKKWKFFELMSFLDKFMKENR